MARLTTILKSVNITSSVLVAALVGVELDHVGVDLECAVRLMPSKFIGLVVRPGEDCKVELPPCSAFEIKHAALAVGGRPSERCTLECNLATHSFVLCSISRASGPLQAVLGTVVTNDPAQSAWFFLKARGSQAFHVLGRLEVDVSGESPAASPKRSKRGAKKGTTVAATGALQANAGLTDSSPPLDVTDSGWDLGAPASFEAQWTAGGAAIGDEPVDIEVLLPGHDMIVEYPSDADSEGFVKWMQSKAAKATLVGPGASKAAADSEPVEVSMRGGGRAARRRAAMRRQPSEEGDSSTAMDTAHEKRQRLAADDDGVGGSGGESRGGEEARGGHRGGRKGKGGKGGKGGRGARRAGR